MLEKNLKRLIPAEINEFPKLNKVEPPYYFLRWDIDEVSNELILRYWFWNKKKNFKNKKRLFINELGTLIGVILKNGYLSRSDFNNLCPRTNKDGTCGFAVIVGILEHLDVIRKIESGKYTLINELKIRNIFHL